jgi:hypothetical protein
MSEYFTELENLIELDFDEDIFENRAREIFLQLKTCDEFIQLASISRWAKFEDDQRAIDMAHDFIDRAIEICVSTKDVNKLEEIASELEYGLELDERASEVMEIIASIKDN